MNSLVSIIVPTYKRKPEILKKALTSLLNQSYSEIEIVVVNDNLPESKIKDEINSFVKKEYANNSMVKLVDNKINLGGALARNEGIKNATGTYITFLDDDDVYLKDKIKSQVAFMEDKGFDLSFSDLIIKNEDEKIIDYREFKAIKDFHNDYLLKYHLMHHITGTPTFMFKAEKLRETGGFEKVIMGQEFFLMLRSIEHNLKIGYFQEAHVVAYRHSGESISVGPNKIKGEKYLYEYKKKYFNLLNNDEQKYVKFRHYAVLSVASKRDKKYKASIMNLIKMVSVSPKSVILETKNQIKKKRTVRV